MLEVIELFEISLKTHEMFISNRFTNPKQTVPFRYYSAAAILSRVDKVSDVCTDKIVDQSQAPSETAAISIIFLREEIY